MTKRRIEPLVWLTFSGGGVMAALFLPMMVFLVAFALPLGWVDVSFAHFDSLLGNPITKLVLLGLFAAMLIHAAHRFRYTLYDGLQIKEKRAVAFLCYGGAILGIFATIRILLSV